MYAQRLLAGSPATNIRWPIDHVLGGRIARFRGRVGVLQPALVAEDPELGSFSQIQPTTFRLDRWRVLQRVRRRILASRASDLYYALYRWL